MDKEDEKALIFAKWLHNNCTTSLRNNEWYFYPKRDDDFYIVKTVEELFEIFDEKYTK